eukprot:scaffold4758_cov79-Skeletonema_dohrnii-CCMP3373.AAC.3
MVFSFTYAPDERTTRLACNFAALVLQCIQQNDVVSVFLCGFYLRSRPSWCGLLRTKPALRLPRFVKHFHFTGSARNFFSLTTIDNDVGKA